MLSIKKWNDKKYDDLSFQNICQIYSDERLNLNSDFIGRIYLIKKGRQFVAQINKAETEKKSGWLREQIWFVMSGECEINIVGETYSLKKGDYLKLPTGKYDFLPIGNEPFEKVWICELPKEFPKIENDNTFR